MKKRLIIAAPVLLILIGVAVYFTQFRKGKATDTRIVSGNIEVTDAQLSFKISGRLIERLVDEGEAVKAGQLIARLDRADQELGVAKARAKILQAEAVLAEHESGSRPQEIADANAELNRTLAESKAAFSKLKLAKADVERFGVLYKEGGISLRDWEVYKTNHETAVNTYEETKARMESAREKLSLRQEGFRAEQIEQARAQVAVDKESLRQAIQQLEYTALFAPFDGVVLSKSAEPGEYLNPGSPVVTIGDLDRVWLRAYVNETNLGRIKLNQEVDVTTDSYPGKVYKGRISFISSEAEFTPKTVQTFEERVKLMFRIKIDLDNAERELKPGMPADAKIRISG